VRESFRTLRSRDGVKPEGEDEPSEQIDLAALAERERK
jgi:hypothetical protein